MSVTLLQWRKALTADHLQPVYLLAGEELLMLEAADALRAQARRLGYSGREVLEAGPAFDWNALPRAGANLSLFASRRLLDLRLPSSGRPGTDGAAALIAFCNDPPPDVTLLVTASSWSNRHEGAWSRKIDASGMMMVFHPPRPHQWHTWIRNRLNTRGLTATSEAVALLAARVEGNLLAAAQEIDKLAMLNQNGATRIDAASMETLITHSARHDVFKLTDAIFAGDAARALHILAVLRAEGEELLAVLGWLIHQLQLILRLARASDFTAQARCERLWPAREQLLGMAIRRASIQHWQHCLTHMTRIDRMIKGCRSGEPWQETERLLVAMARPQAASALL